MSRIAILPSAVADQIAAGEVVERPASVVKELVENALDAGATTVDVTIEEGGRVLVRVADDGCGMDASDAVLALERHATSKLTTAEGLVGIRSYGFRGEALPAIASVSEVEIETAADGGAGIVVRVAAGTLIETRATARRRGTTVSVSRLFYNTPARLKFLKSARSEWRGIVDIMHAIATLRRDVHFTLRHDGKVALDLPASDTLRARLGALWGHRDMARFVDVDDVHGPVHVLGLVERPADVGTATRRILLMINGRTVRDHGFVRAAEAAYRSTLPSGVRPSLVLHLHVPGDSVDVNVHPAKSEVRLRDRWPAERAVESAVRRGLGLFDASAGIGWRTFTPAPVIPDWQRGHHALEPDALRAQPEADGLFRGNPIIARAADAATTVGLPRSAGEGVPSTPDAAQFEPSPQPVIVPPLMQLRRTYLMFEHEEGVVLIDQHSAHERILYERFLGTLERGDAPSQRLLFPMTLHLGPEESEAFDEHRPSLELLGFEIDHFGGHSLLVHAVPMPHPRFDAERCLRETLAALVGDRTPGDAKRHERLAAMFACKAAIKAGDILSPGEMRALYIALADTRLAAHDVHGRSTIVRVSWDEIDRRFGRR